MRDHWLKSLGVTTLIFACFWLLIVSVSTVQVVYNDHVNSWKRYQQENIAIYGKDGQGGLQRRLADLNESINGSNGYKAALEGERKKTQEFQTKFDVLSAVRSQPKPEEDREPDGIYQFGKLVGEFSGERIDEANNRVVFESVRTQGHFDNALDLEFRNLIIHCDGVVGGPEPGTTAGVFIGMTVGGSCRLVGARAQQ